MYRKIIEELRNKKIAILGLGREGISTYNFIRRYLKDQELTILDGNEKLLDNNEMLRNDLNLKFNLGDTYLSDLDKFDLIIKTPGVSFKGMDISSFRNKISSQLQLFLKYIPNIVVGITGTKGKSTTSSLIYKIIKDQGKDVLLLGNIGVPLFNLIEDIKAETIIVIEMSSHQLEFVTYSPSISILTNLFQEHLDHYNSYEEYMEAKINIARYQGNGNYFIYNKDDVETLSHIGNIKSKKIEISRYDELPSDINNPKLIGDSSKYNIGFALKVAGILGLDINEAIKSINTFETLSHRIEFVGTYNGIKFYDDAIATIPEATINSIEALKIVDTLIVGGLNRGVELQSLIDYLDKGIVRNLLCMPETGYLIADALTNKDINVFRVETMEEVVELAFTHTLPGKVCLLAPAAASYNKYKNFEEKGNHYKELVKTYNTK